MDSYILQYIKKIIVWLNKEEPCSKVVSKKKKKKEKKEKKRKKERIKADV